MNVQDNHPLVGISCVTFNQAPFLRDMLEGIAMQKTTFSFVAVIGDDASTDNTAEILEEYRSRYPHIFKIINQPVNRGVIENSLIVLDNMPPVRYIAFCEGDDYWTDPLKLQKQVDCMERDPECSICFHASRVRYENDQDKQELLPTQREIRIFSKGVPQKLLFERNFIPTASVMYRRQVSAADFRKIYKDDMLPGDWFWHLFHIRYGNIRFIPDVMSVYRRHDTGIFSSLDSQREIFYRKFGIKHCRFFEEALKLFEKDSAEYAILLKSSRNFFLEFLDSCVKTDDMQMLEQFIKSFSVEFLLQLTGYKRSTYLLYSLSRNVCLYCYPQNSFCGKFKRLFLRLLFRLRNDGMVTVIRNILQRISKKY